MQEENAVDFLCEALKITVEIREIGYDYLTVNFSKQASSIENFLK